MYQLYNSLRKNARNFLFGYRQILSFSLYCIVTKAMAALPSFIPRKGVHMKAFHEVRNYRSDFMVWQCAYTNVSFLAHWHQEIELIYLRSGSARFCINEHNFTARAGDLVLIDTGDFHYSDSSEMKNELDFLIFDPSVISPLYRHSNYAHPLIASEMLKNCGLAEELASLFDTAHTELQEQKPYYQEIVTASLRSFWYRLRRVLPREAMDTSRNRRSHMLEEMQQLLAYMDSHYSEDITLSFAAKKMNFSESYFSRVFKRLMGINFVTYLNMIRVEHAATELKISGNRVLDIALSSGFNNIRTFNRVFKEITGYTPSQFLSLDDPDSINLSYYKRKSPHQEFVEYDSLTLVRNDERSVSHEKTNPVPQTPHS